MKDPGKVALVLVFAAACGKNPGAPDQLLACEGGGEPLVTVRVTDVDGAPFTPDRVIYNIDADGPYDGEVDDLTEHEAECADEACTAFLIGCGLEAADLYISAEYHDDVQDCDVSADDERTLQPGDEPIEITLAVGGKPCDGVPG
jgi:hypothetical protein